MTIELGGVPISLSTSGGALLAGLVISYLRTVRRRSAASRHPPWS